MDGWMDRRTDGWMDGIWYVHVMSQDLQKRLLGSYPKPKMFPTFFNLRCTFPGILNIFMLSYFHKYDSLSLRDI